MHTLTLAFYPPYNSQALDDAIFKPILSALADRLQIPISDFEVNVPVLDSEWSASRYPFVLTVTLPFEKWLHIDVRELEWPVAIKAIAAGYEELASELYHAVAPHIPFRVPWRLQVWTGEGAGHWPSDSSEP